MGEPSKSEMEAPKETNRISKDGKKVVFTHGVGDEKQFHENTGLASTIFNSDRLALLS